MNVKSLFFLAIIGLFFAVSCNRDDISFDSPSKEFRFSSDTVFCDTVYHQIRSETYAVKVYNDEDKDILIPKIELKKGVNSLYKINVDGQPGYSFSDVPLRKKDSLYIFIEIAPQANGTEMIAEDQIVFSQPTGKQEVTLLSVVQDAEFFIETPTHQNTLSGNVNWTNEKAKIIFGDLTLEENSTLNIQKGTKVYFYNKSGLKIKSNSTLNINGELGEEVILRGHRNDAKYDTLPKNWKSIEFEPNTHLNVNYAKVFGGTNGFVLEQSEATIKNSIIHTFEEHGVKAINSVVNAENLVMNNSGIANFGIYNGGNYSLKHATLYNDWTYMSPSIPLVLYVSNEWESNGQTFVNPLSINIGNSILYGGQYTAVVFKRNPNAGFNYLLENCLLKYEESLAQFTFENNTMILNSLINENPLLMDTSISTMNFRLKVDSPAKNIGSQVIANTVPEDIAGVSRVNNPSLGAYQ